MFFEAVPTRLPFIYCVDLTDAEAEFLLLLTEGVPTFQFLEADDAEPLAKVQVELLPFMYEKDPLTVTDHSIVPREFL